MIAKQNVVVGGGIAGICTALFLAKKGEEVVIIEKGSSLGGLLRSIHPFNDEYHFDFGTHFLAQTGDETLDKLLYGNLEVREFDYLKVGSFYKEIFEGNGFVTDFHLSNREIYFDQINLNYIHKNFNNLNKQLINSYGLGYTENLFDPILKKFYGLESNQLQSNAHFLFGLQRIITKDSATTKTLKAQNKVYDSLLAYHEYTDGISSKKAMYPVKGGVGNWVKYLIEKLNSNGVKVYLDTNIEEIEYSHNCIDSIKVNGHTIDVANLYWTAPSVFLLPYLNLHIKSFIPRLTSHVLHYVVDEEYLTKLYYFQCFDPNFKTFRVTLYDNFSLPCHKKYRRITVELLVRNKDEITSELPNEVFKELIAMGVISDSTKIIQQTSQTIPNSFPILSKDENEEDQPEVSLKGQYSNLHFFGKAYSKKWFMSEVIGEIYNSIYETNIV